MSDSALQDRTFASVHPCTQLQPFPDLVPCKAEHYSFGSHENDGGQIVDPMPCKEACGHAENFA